MVTVTTLRADERIYYPCTRTRTPRLAAHPHLRTSPADLAEVVRIYGIHNWIEQNYKQVKDELG